MKVNGLFSVVFGFLVLCLASASSFSAKEVKPESPFVVVQGLTDGMMAVIRADSELYKVNPDQYFDRIHGKLEASVGFRLIAKNVMGQYRKVANKAQRERFTAAFTRSLVETLGKGLASYSDLKVVTLPFDASKGNLALMKKVEVVQQIEAVDGTTHVSYTMAKNKSGQWKMVNVVLNGINLGKQFRNQFKQSMKQNDNNIEKVIDGWAKPA